MPFPHRYIGSWRGDKKHGQGSMVWAAQRQQYTGEWVDDSPHGVGTMVWTEAPGVGRYGPAIA